MSVETGTGTVEVIGDGIISFRFHSSTTTITQKDLEENCSAVHDQLGGGGSMVMVLSHDLEFTPEAREYMLNECKEYKFLAIVIEKLPQRIWATPLVNAKGEQTARIFDKGQEREALKWIERQMYLLQKIWP